MADSITAGEKTLLRADGHKAELFLSIMAPDSILVARLNNADAARGDRAIVYDGGSGSAPEFARILAGQPLWVGTSAGDNDRGITRVKSITGDETAGTITVAENASIGWTDDDYLTILEEYPLFPKFPRFWQEGTGDSLVSYWRKDYDVEHTDENEEPPPVAIMGPHRAGMLASGTVRFYLDSSESYAVAVGATISSTAWTSTGGTIDSAASAATHIDMTTADYYWIACTVTDSNGKTMTTRRCFFVHNATVGHADYPHVDFEITTFNGNWNRGGWNVNLNVRDDGTLTDIPDKALIVIWQDATYGSTNQDIGGWVLNSADARHVLFAGYVRGDTVTRDWETSRVQFQASSITGLLQKTPSDGIYVGVHDDHEWCDYEDLTFSRALHYLLHWHSTLFAIADVYLPTMTSYQVKEVLDFAGGTLYTQAAGFARNFSIYAGICANKGGQIHVERDINSISATDRGNVQDVCDIGETDRRDRPDLTVLRQEEARAYSVTASGLSWDGTDAAAYISNAPGTVKNDEGRGIRNLERQIFDDQDAANTFAGRILAIENNDIREIRVPFKGHYLGVLDVVPQEWWRMTLASGDTERGISLSARQMVPRTVTAKFDVANGSIKADAIMEPEASGVDGLTSDYPTAPPTSDPPEPEAPTEPDPAPDPPDEPTGLGTVYVATETHVGHTADFDASGGASWTDKTGAVTGTILDFILDPWDPRNGAYVFSRAGAGSTTSGLWTTADLDEAAPTWTLMLTIAQMEADSPGAASADAYTKIMGSPNEDGYIACLLKIGDYMGCWHSHDRGDSWTYATVIAKVSNGMWWHGAADIVPHTVGGDLTLYIVLIQYINLADNVTVYKSSTHGGSWVTYYAASSDWHSAPDYPNCHSLHCPYDDNEDGLVYYIASGASTGSGNPHRVMRGSGYPPGRLFITPPDTTDFKIPRFHRTGVESATYDQDRLFCYDRTGGVYRLQISDDRGSTWTDQGLMSAKGVGAQVYAAGGFPYNDELFYTLGTNGIFYSLDRGETFSDATGDWVAEVGAWSAPKVIVPMWLE